jgi:hypothetical protein
MRLIESSPQVKLRISKSVANLGPVELIRAHILIPLSSTTFHHFYVLSIEKPCLSGVVG